ncbi:hypothetical protein PHYSODRAFT_246325 [Phytophthora sojae]|uniref:Magnesium transporter n=1 Tax=Phytophthora sojae (strain P6497) TaxID=1094619 RepID=G4YJ49_PHYSP|nr:hypothetical protein PHYSODRAFT_246325 [Phytophthora sojae]EGZ29189.1 hypothetical protein PHYSODRAFT_246325 [Phytophthora sojae]|eukprot:XP_009516464.1 hypothetical protein PHYSODRAFT_246325 [Phytophthora sojae]
MTPPEQLSLYVMEGVLISVQGANTLWSALKQRLHVSYSKARQHSTAFLMYTIMDVCVNELSPISHMFGAKLLMLERLLSLDPRYFDMRRIAGCSKQIEGLQMHCTPMRDVISKLVASGDYQGETLQYLVDVQDHLTTIEEECEANLDRYDVTYILALVAAIFLPGQFLTGMYGMNFKYIPEQRYYYGYFVWWAVMILIADLIVLFFKLKNTRPLPLAHAELALAPFFKRRFRSWHLEHVRLALQRYRLLTLRCCVDALQLSAILGIKEKKLVDDVMRLFLPRTPTRVQCMVDAMEVLIALVLVCQAPGMLQRFEHLEAKGAISTTDLIMLCGAVGRAIMKLFEYKVEPEQHAAMAYVTEVLDGLGVGRSGSIGKEALCKFMVSDRFAVHYAKQCTGEERRRVSGGD